MLELKDKEKTRILNEVKKQLDLMIVKWAKDRKEFNKFERKRVE